MVSSSGEKNKKRRSPPKSTEAVGGPATNKGEPTPKREPLLIVLMALKFPTFQYKTPSESFNYL